MSLELDKRIIMSRIADIKKEWEGGEKYEYLAIEWGIKRYLELYPPTIAQQPLSGSADASPKSCRFKKLEKKLDIALEALAEADNAFDYTAPEVSHRLIKEALKRLNDNK